MSLNIHLSTEQTLDFLEGRLDPEMLTKVSEHLSSGCPDCAKNLTVFSRMFEAIQASSWPSPPTRVHNQAVRAFNLAFPAKLNSHRSVVLYPIFVGLALIAIVLIILFRGFPPQTAYAANLDVVTGRVDVKVTPSTSWQASSSGQSFPIGATIRTASNGQAILIFPGGDRTILGPNTQLELTGLTRTNNQWQITMDQMSGDTQNVSSSKTSLFRVQTVAGITDTNKADFTLGVEEDGTTVIKVKEGKVKANSSGGFLLISSGQIGLLHKNSAPTTLEVTPNSATPTSIPSATPTPDENNQSNQTQATSPTQNETRQPDKMLTKTPRDSNTRQSNQQNNQSPTASPHQDSTQQEDETDNHQESPPVDNNEKSD